MARVVLAVGAVAWLLASAAGFGMAAFGASWLQSLLPPLAIGVQSLAGAVATLAFGSLVIGSAHVAALAGLRGGSRIGYSGAILLTAVLTAGLVALGVAALTSAVSQPSSAVGLIGSGVVTLAAAIGYGLAAARLVAELAASAAD